jgi:hypothetical protein
MAATMSVAAVVAVMALLAVPAQAQDYEVDTPPGYEFCGWKDFVNGGWTYDEPEPGAYLRLFARKMSCRTARRKYNRVRYEQSPPYRPKLKGYRCVRLESRLEYEDTRCSKKRRPKIAIRWQTGA